MAKKTRTHAEDEAVAVLDPPDDQTPPVHDEMAEVGRVLADHEAQGSPPGYAWPAGLPALLARTVAHLAELSRGHKINAMSFSARENREVLSAWRRALGRGE